MFLPRPKVESVLVSIVRRAPPDIAPQDLFPLINRLLYGRRRMLRSSLEGVSPEEFAACGLTGEERPWGLSQSTLIALARTDGWKRQVAMFEKIGRPFQKRARDPWMHAPDDRSASDADATADDGSASVDRDEP